jgi:hypothetical protein
LAHAALLLVTGVGRFIAAQLTFLERIDTSKDRIGAFHVVRTAVSSILIVGSLEQLKRSRADRLAMRLVAGQDDRQLPHSTPRAGIEQRQNRISRMRSEEVGLEFAEFFLAAAEEPRPGSSRRFCTDCR